VTNFRHVIVLKLSYLYIPDMKLSYYHAQSCLKMIICFSICHKANRCPHFYSYSCIFRFFNEQLAISILKSVLSFVLKWELSKHPIMSSTSISYLRMLTDTSIFSKAAIFSSQIATTKTVLYPKMLTPKVGYLIITCTARALDANEKFFIVK
jgi:hypothetical protein